MSYPLRITLPGLGPSPDEEPTVPGVPLLAQSAPSLLEPWMLEALRDRLRETIAREEESGLMRRTPEGGLERCAVPPAVAPDPLADLEITVEDPELEALGAALGELPELEVGLAPNSESNFYAAFDEAHPDGLFVATYARHAVNAPLHVVMCLPGGARIRAAAWVEWVRPAEAAADGLPAGLGLRLAGLGELERRHIARFARSRRPYFFA
ncbi:MAG: hypothetical protein IT378_08930 [Sandaracinaceae bacterium]|nr:hypothetical protein [Sandaracinaceae bacterium]